MGSPTALAEKVLEENLRSMAKSSGHTLYIPSGALWGGADLEHMAQQGTLKVKAASTLMKSAAKTAFGSLVWYSCCRREVEEINLNSQNISSN